MWMRFDQNNCATWPPGDEEVLWHFVEMNLNLLSEIKIHAGYPSVYDCHERGYRVLFNLEQEKVYWMKIPPVNNSTKEEFLRPPDETFYW